MSRHCTVFLPGVVLLGSLSFLTEKCAILIKEKHLPGAWDGSVFNFVL